jgi:acetyltransferase
MALVAILGQDGGEHIIGVARYSVIQDESLELAEPAIVVEDRYQGLGLGMLLFERLVVYARRHGICAFLGYVNHGNTKVMRLMRGVGLPIKTSLAVSGVWEVHMELELEAG